MSQYQNEPDCVEAPQGANNLLFKDEKQQARFELGVSMMIYKWDALDVAVENQWGGPDSAEKRDWITAIIVDLFKTEKVVETILIEETLLYAMVDVYKSQVKKYENGFINFPVVISSSTTVGEAKKMKQQFGFAGFPVTGMSITHPYLVSSSNSPGRKKIEKKKKKKEKDTFT